MNVDKRHKALLCLAEEFRTKHPPDLKSCMQCLHAILNLPALSPYIIAKTNYHLGSLIHKYTYDTQIAQTYLEKAYEQSQTPDLMPIRLQVVAQLVDIHLIQNQRTLAKQLLTRAINETTTSGGGHFNLYWHYRFLLKLSHLNLEDGEFANANNQLSIGAQTAGATNDSFTRTLFLLSKGMVLMIARKYPNSIIQQPQHVQQVNPEQQLVETMSTASNLIEAWPGESPRKEALKVYFLVLQVCHHLNKGHNKSAKPCLKLLQQSIQNLTTNIAPGNDNLAIEDIYFISQNMSENFVWMPKEHMCVLVYLISVLHSMQAGFLDKAQRYTEKALMQIERLRQQSPEPDYLLESFHILLLEHMSMCHLVMGSRVSAIKQTCQAMQLCYRPRLRIRHRGIIRTLLGFYAMSMSMIEEAEKHFTRVMNDNDVGTELRVMAMLNLALCYLQDDTRRFERRHDVEVLLSRLNPEQLNSLSYCLKAAAYYVYGLKAFCDERFNDAKKNLRETLKMANGEDLNRVTSCSLVLLGKIFNNSELPRESLNMVSPAMKLAGKIPDIHVQLWASSVLKEIYARDVNSQHHIEAANMHAGFSSRLNEDKLQAVALPEHGYVRWEDF